VDVLLATNAIFEEYQNCQHIPKPICLPPELPDSLKFHSRYGLNHIGSEWYRVPDIYGSECLLFHPAQSSPSFQHVEGVGRKRIVAADQFLIAYFPTRIKTIRIWKLVDFKFISDDKLSEWIHKVTKSYENWELNNIRISYNSDAIVLLLSLEGNVRTLVVNLKERLLVSGKIK